jgi:hypothetical protein
MLHKQPPFIAVRPLDAAQSTHSTDRLLEYTHTDCFLEHGHVQIDQLLAAEYLKRSRVYKAFFVSYINRA